MDLQADGVVASEPRSQSSPSSIPSVIATERLVLVPITLAMVEAVMAGDRRRAEELAKARLPDAWPGSELIHRGFGASLDEIRADERTRLWGDRLLIPREGEPRVIGSVVFHGRPGSDGIAEVGYGVEEGSRGFGLATEGTRACVRWALTQPGVHTVTATTFPWHAASLRVIEKLGMQLCDSRDHELFGELLVFKTTLADFPT